MLPTNRSLYFIVYFSFAILDKTPMEALNYSDILSSDATPLVGLYGTLY